MGIHTVPQGPGDDHTGSAGVRGDVPLATGARPGKTRRNVPGKNDQQTVGAGTQGHAMCLVIHDHRGFEDTGV